MSAPYTIPQGHATSAIQGMTVAEIRRALNKLRDLWQNATPESPLFVCDKLYNDKTIAEFAKEFVFGHHLKRHFKSVMQASLTVKRAAEPPPRNSLTQHMVPLHCPVKKESTAVPGPKGDSNDPFPFSATWKPKTQRGKRAFAEASSKTEEPAQTPEPEHRVLPKRKCKGTPKYTP